MKAFEWLHLTLRDAELQPFERLVVYALATHTYGNGSCTATWAQLQEWTGLSRSSVYRNLMRIADRGWIAPLPRRSDGGRQAATLYLLTCGQPGDEPVDNNPRPKVQSVTQTPIGVSHRHPGEHDQGVTQTPPIEGTKYLEANDIASYVRAVASTKRLR